MKHLLKLTGIGFAVVALGVTSCSDDNDGPEVDTPTNPIEDVFTSGLPLSVDGATFTTNDKGQVTRIVDGNDIVTFEYGTFTRAENFNAKMTVEDKEYPEDGCVFYMQLNKQGFVTYALQEYNDPEEGTDTWRFEYNADGQLTRLLRSEGGDDFTITYTNGDITSVKQVEEDGDTRTYTINYVNAKPNKGCVMLFDDMFQIDMDEMGIAYYAGLLGKATKNLPTGYDENSVEGGNSYNYSETYHWEFNSNDFPTKFWSGDYEWDAITFSWK